MCPLVDEQDEVAGCFHFAAQPLRAGRPPSPRPTDDDQRVALERHRQGLPHIATEILADVDVEARRPKASGESLGFEGRYRGRFRRLQWVMDGSKMHEG